MKRLRTIVVALAVLVSLAPSASAESVAVGHLVAQGVTWPPLPLTGCTYTDETLIDGTLFIASTDASSGWHLQLGGYNDFASCDSVLRTSAAGSAYGDSLGWFVFIRGGTDAQLDGEFRFADTPAFRVAFSRCVVVPQGLGFEVFQLDCTLELSY